MCIHFDTLFQKWQCVVMREALAHGCRAQLTRSRRLLGTFCMSSVMMDCANLCI